MGQYLECVYSHYYIAPALPSYICCDSAAYDVLATSPAFSQIEASLVHKHKDVRDFTYKNDDFTYKNGVWLFQWDATLQFWDARHVYLVIVQILDSFAYSSA